MVRSIPVDVYVIHPVDRRTMRRIHTVKAVGDAVISLLDTEGDEFVCVPLPGDGIKIYHRDVDLDPDPKLLAALANAVDDIQYMYNLISYPMLDELIAAGNGTE